jgi:hypothetical protein
MRALLDYIDEAHPNRAELREFMQDHEMWDRSALEGLFTFLDIPKAGKRYRLGKVSRRLADAVGDGEDIATAMFQHILHQNPILIRYVFDALEERIYSDAELWRYLTSYAYPGDHMGGPELRNWIRWMGLCGIIRLIGVRWGLAKDIDEARRLVERIDVEELLDEDGDEDEDEEDDDEVSGAAPSRRERPAVAEELDLPDAPGMKPAPGPDLPAAVASVPGEVSTPSRRALPFAPSDLDPAEALAENLVRLRAWWADVHERDLTRADDLGLMPMAYEAGDKAVHIFQLVSLATLVVGDPRPVDRLALCNRLNRARFFPRVLADPTDALAILEEWGWLRDEPAQAAMMENLVHILAHRAALVADPGLPDLLAAAAGPDALLALLRERFFGAGAGLEPHWVIREMARSGLWKQEGLEKAASVPSRGARETAWRLGLLEHHHAATTADLSVASQGIGAALGAADGFDEPLAHFARHHGCAFGCPHTLTCPFHCREKSDY